MCAVNLKENAGTNYNYYYQLLLLLVNGLVNAYEVKAGKSKNRLHKFYRNQAAIFDKFKHAYKRLFGSSSRSVGVERLM